MFSSLLKRLGLSRKSEEDQGRTGTTHSSWEAWKYYSRGQGVVLLGFILMGGLLASVASYFGPLSGQVSTGGHLVEYRALDLSERDVVTDYITVAQYSRLTVLTRTVAPDNGSATIIIYGVRRDGVATEVQRIQSVSTSWSSWEQENVYSNLRLIVERPAQEATTSATEVDVLVYLHP